MGNKRVKIPSLYGPVELELVQCDGPECPRCIQPDHMIGWLELDYQGTTVRTMGNSQIQARMDFCGLDCLKRAVDMMTGS